MDEMKSLVNLAKFSPVGNRGFIKGRGCGFGYKEWAKDIREFMETSNEQLLVLPQCETLECLNIIEDVVEIEGIDGIFIGPFDLSIAMGIPAQFDHPDFTAAIERILRACKKASKLTFIFTRNLADAKKYMEKGFDGIAHTIDSTVLIEGYRTIVENLKESI